MERLLWALSRFRSARQMKRELTLLFLKSVRRVAETFDVVINNFCQLCIANGTSSWCEHRNNWCSISMWSRIECSIKVPNLIISACSWSVPKHIFRHKSPQQARVSFASSAQSSYWNAAESWSIRPRLVRLTRVRDKKNSLKSLILYFD